MGAQPAGAVCAGVQNHCLGHARLRRFTAAGGVQQLRAGRRSQNPDRPCWRQTQCSAGPQHGRHDCAGACGPASVAGAWPDSSQHLARLRQGRWGLAAAVLAEPFCAAGPGPGHGRSGPPAGARDVCARRRPGPHRPGCCSDDQCAAGKLPRCAVGHCVFQPAG